MSKSAFEILEGKYAEALLDDDNHAYHGAFKMWGEQFYYNSDPLRGDTSLFGFESTTFEHSDTGYAFTITTDSESSSITENHDLVLLNVWNMLHKLDAYYRNTTGTANFQLDLVWQLVSAENEQLLKQYDALQNWYDTHTDRVTRLM